MRFSCLKLGEMVLKGLNRRTFEERLMGNARRRLEKFGKFRIYSRQSITYIEPKTEDCDMDGAFETLTTSLRRGGSLPCQGLREDPGGHSGDGQDLPARRPHGRPDALRSSPSAPTRSFPMTSIQLSQFVGGELNEAFTPYL